jgi:hypothetical protein
MGSKTQAGNGMRPPDTEEECVGSQDPQRTVVLEKRKK